MSNHRSDRGFSVCLAEELLRAELHRHFGEAVRLYQSNITATPVSHTPLKKRQDLADWERQFGGMFRVVVITALVGCGMPEEEHGRDLYRVSAVIRLFGKELSCVLWYPHYVMFTVYPAYTSAGESHTCVYEPGTIDGVRTVANAQNPCRVMVATQVLATYPGLHGLTEKPVTVD